MARFANLAKMAIPVGRDLVVEESANWFSELSYVFCIPLLRALALDLSLFVHERANGNVTE